MTAENDSQHDLETLLVGWIDNQKGIKKAFVRLRDNLIARNDLRVSFKSRPGVSYSLRAAHALQEERVLFVIMDIIDDDPENRWLSVCFYPDMITDPEARGHLIPLGLLGEDGYCFDLEEWDEEYLCYLERRQDEAYEVAAK